jgi:hypothetical protein
VDDWTFHFIPKTSPLCRIQHMAHGSALTWSLAGSELEPSITSMMPLIRNCSHESVKYQHICKNSGSGFPQQEPVTWRLKIKWGFCQFINHILPHRGANLWSHWSVDHDSHNKTNSRISEQQETNKDQATKRRDSSDLVTPRICINLNLVTVFLEPPNKTTIF